MKPIRIFYHLYIPSNVYASSWPIWVDQQLGLLISAGLTPNSTVYMTITMPKYWNDCNGYKFRKNNKISSDISVEYCLFYEKVIEYITLRYPFVSILDIRDSGEPNIYEGQCLRFIHSMSKHEDAYYLYFHSKGISTISELSTHSWREVLGYYMISEWKNCIRLLSTHDVVCVLDAGQKVQIKSKMPIFPSGNFWWANTTYINTLPEPLDSSKYLSDEYIDAYPNGVSYRYCFERWISTGLPKFGVMIDTDTAHYDNYCFLENINNKIYIPYTINSKDYI